MIAILLACGPSPAPPTPTTEAEKEVEAHAGPRPSSWVEPRVKEAQARLAETPGGQLLWKGIEAHGGLEPFLALGTLAFDFDYAPVGSPEKRRYSRNRVDLWSRKAVQDELGPEADAHLGWNGTEAWITPSPESFPSDARFWATTPFYFVGLPWVLADEGTHHALLDPVVVPATGLTDPLPTVKTTYGSGVGDAPDDYYILHLHPETHQIVAIRYVVSYFSKTGHGEETLQLWSDHTDVDGLLVATTYAAHKWNDGTPGPLKTNVSVANITFGEPIPLAAFEPPPEGAIPGG